MKAAYRSGSFRAKLMWFGFMLAALVALPMLVEMAQRPFNLLHGMIDRGRLVLTTAEAGVQAEELARMQAFTLRMAELVPARIKASVTGAAPDLAVDEESYPVVAPSQAFYLLITRGELPDEKEVLAVFEQQSLTYPGYDYGLLVQWYAFWKNALDQQPGLQAAFGRAWSLLNRAAKEARGQGFEIADLYIMLDRGQAAGGLFERNMVFMLEGLPWYDNTYPGQAFDLVKNATENWRAPYDRSQGGRPGLYNSQVHDPEHYYLPEFDTDEWGTWFSVWLARESEQAGAPLYTVYNIDFEASHVSEVMLTVVYALVIGALLVTLIIAWVAIVFSRRLSRPIDALAEGAEAVMAQRYEHRVPQVGYGEFARLIDIFNRMTEWVREMVNLKATLTKLLSEELAEKAAQSGLVLGGKNANCTIMFTDFAGFSTLSQSLSAAEVVKLLNDYFGDLVPIIKKWGGFPDKYIGDAIVAIFGAPVAVEDHADRAVKCAVELQKKMREINARLRAEGHTYFEMRIGINSGEVLVGAIGCDMKLEYTSIGDTTNLANRMESKSAIGHVMIAEATYQQLSSKQLEGAELSTQAEMEQVKGYVDAVKAYPVWVDDLHIERSASAEDPLHFYRYSSRQGG